ncbi:hypothetical protein D3C87_1693400 [compost metagenome]
MSFAYSGDFSFIKLTTTRCIQIRQTNETAKINTQELVQKPVKLSKYPKIIGPKKPPKPPNIPTIPPITPTSFGK